MNVCRGLSQVGGTVNDQLVGDIATTMTKASAQVVASIANGASSRLGDQCALRSVSSLEVRPTAERAHTEAYGANPMIPLEGKCSVAGPSSALGVCPMATRA